MCRERLAGLPQFAFLFDGSTLLPVPLSDDGSLRSLCCHIGGCLPKPSPAESVPQFDAYQFPTFLSFFLTTTTSPIESQHLPGQLFELFPPFQFSPPLHRDSPLFQEVCNPPTASFAAPPFSPCGPLFSPSFFETRG